MYKVPRRSHELWMLSLDRCTKSNILTADKCHYYCSTASVHLSFSLSRTKDNFWIYISFNYDFQRTNGIFLSQQKSISISINQGLSQISISYFGEIKHGMHKSIKNKNKKYTSEEIDLSPS